MCKVFFRPDATASESFSLDGTSVFKKALNRFFCPECITDFQPVEPPWCPVCGMVFPFEDENEICEECCRIPRYFHQARAVGIYDGILKVIIHELKFRGRIHLAKPLGELLLNSMNRMYGQKQPDAVIPIPLHPKKHRMRGFNQAYLLACQLQKLSSQRPSCPPLSVDKNLLVRSRWTDSQSGLGKDKRKSNISSAFQVVNAENVRGKHFLLIDDVYTTGATADECARTLKMAGAGRVDVLTLARTL